MYKQLLNRVALATIACISSATASLPGSSAAATAIQYTNFGSTGTYNRVTNIDGCVTSPQAYSGPMAPFDEELSVHFRGPISLKQFAVYTPGSSNAGSKAKRDAHKHMHARKHAKDTSLPAVEARDEPSETAEEYEKRDMVVVTMNGTPVSWENNYDPTAAPAANAQSSAAPAPAATSIVSQNSIANNVVAAAVSKTAKSTSAAAAQTSTPKTNSNIAGSWQQVAYYDSTAGTANGITFLATNYSPLEFMGADGISTAKSAQILKDTTIESNKEFSIWTSTQCANGNCGYFDPALSTTKTAFHGFGGASKLFVFEFSMPHDTAASSGQYQNPDMPAIWMLNSLIDRTGQYGCSCWGNTNGCGEFDLFEVLAKGSTQLTSGVHGQQAYTGADYIERPVGATMKASVLMDASQATIKVLPSDFVFGETVDVSSLSGSSSANFKLPN